MSNVHVIQRRRGVEVVRAVVVGASSGLGRCIGIGLAERGAEVALLARRKDKLDAAVEEAGDAAFSVACDVTDPESCASSFEEAANRLGGIDALVYTPALGVLAPLVDIDLETWQRVFLTNVTGAAIVTTAALPYLRTSAGRAVYLSSVSASETPPWPGLGSYAVSKAALDKLVEAWRVEHPEVAFTRIVVGECVGGEGDGQTHFAAGWDPDLAVKYGAGWYEKGLIASTMLAVDDLVTAIDSVLRSGATAAIPSIVVTPRPTNA